MADSSSDSSELRNYLRELRQRTGAGCSPSRIPKPQTADSANANSKSTSGGAAAATGATATDPPAGRGGRAAALLNKVAGLGAAQRERRRSSQVRDESGSPTSSPTLSNSKKEVSFKLDTAAQNPKQSRIPRSPQLLKRQNSSPTTTTNAPATAETRARPVPSRSPDVGRHQIRRSPSPYHRNCQHSAQSTSPEPQRTPSPRTRSAKLQRTPSKTTASSLSESAVSKPASQDDADKADSEKPDATRSTTTTRTTTTKAKVNSESTTKTASGSSSSTKILSGRTDGSADRGTAAYSDTFEESSSRTKPASLSRHSRSKSLDTDLHRRTPSDATTTAAVTEASSSSVLRTLKKSKSTSSASSRSSTLPNWWFPAILPPQHFGGEHLDELQKLHAGVLDDLFRFQVGLIEKHQQRADSRHKAIREFVTKNHEYTNWRSYQNDPRVQFVKWHREAGFLEAP